MLRRTGRPLVILPMRRDGEEKNVYLGVDYAESLEEAGLCPVYLPLLENPSSLDAVLEHASGICLTGSHSDLDPAYYGQPPQPALGPIQPRRDNLDRHLLRRAFSSRLPLLAICYGFQSLNVFLGGTLIQDLDSAGYEGKMHRAPAGGPYPFHTIDLVPGGVLASLSLEGSGPVSVNSSHHQAIRTLGKRLKADALAPDGIVEAACLEDPNHFVLGVQWHPESIRQESPLSAALFQHFADACLHRSFRA